jgi:hypothetical protein
VIDQIQILSKFNLREDCFNRPDDVDSRPDELIHKARIAIQISPSGHKRATNMEIADSTSTVRTTAYHGPDARIADMEIAC